MGITKVIINWLADVGGYVLPPLLGGIVDYLNQLQAGTKHWDWSEFIVHLVSAVFFGWLTGLLAGGLGYDVEIVAAAGGMGGFLGVRIADLVTYRLMNVERRKKG